ncbi:MAG TPA: hypothetical protein VJB70_03320 [Candidatus Paceibacterota bacterium]
MDDTDLGWPPPESVKSAVAEKIMGIGLAFFIVHSLLYALLLTSFSHLIAGTEFVQHIYIPGFRFMDPGIWLFWFGGWLFIIESLFLTKRYILLVIASLVLYVVSFIPALIWGFMYGLGAVVGAGFFAVFVIWLGKKELIKN